MALPDPVAALGLLLEPARWPDFGSITGRFTALRSGGLLVHTFEIEVNAAPTPRSPIFTRGYVTCTTLATADDDGELRDAVDDLAERYDTGAGPGVPPLLGPDVVPLALVILRLAMAHLFEGTLALGHHRETFPEVEALLTKLPEDGKKAMRKAQNAASQVGGQALRTAVCTRSTVGRLREAEVGYLRIFALRLGTEIGLVPYPVLRKSA